MALMMIFRSKEKTMCSADSQKVLIVKRACLEHKKTGSIKNICKETGVDKVKMRFRMNNNGYSLVTRKFSLNSCVKQSENKFSKNSIAGVYDKILYNKILSYCEGFKMHQPFHLQGQIMTPNITEWSRLELNKAIAEIELRQFTTGQEVLDDLEGSDDVPSIIFVDIF